MAERVRRDDDRSSAALRRAATSSTSGTFWAGPYLAMYLGAFGADVVKVESIQRPDGFRFSGAFPQEGDDFYDRGPVWQGTNLNKRDVTLDVNRDDGARLVRDADRERRHRDRELLGARR